MPDNDTPQRSEEGDARREVSREAMRVLRGETEELLIRLRRSSAGNVYIKSYTPSE